MNKFISFFQSNFLKDFFQNVPSDLNQNKEVFLGFWKMLNDNSDKIFVSDLEQIKLLQKNPYIRRLIKHEKKIIDFLPNHFDNLDEDPTLIFKNFMPCSFHFYNKKVKELINDSGFFISDLDSCYDSFSKICSKPTSIPVNKDMELNQFKGWDFFAEKLPPRNALILSDNYLFKSEAYGHNIFSLLKHFLPDKLNQNFHLSIVVDENVPNPEKKYETILKYLKNLDVTYKIDFGLFITRGKMIHDRDLISNYFRMRSGHGFDLINKNGNIKKNTEINYFPINSEITPSAHFLFLKRLKKETQRSSCIGFENNRLLEW